MISTDKDDLDEIIKLIMMGSALQQALKQLNGSGKFLDPDTIKLAKVALTAHIEIERLEAARDELDRTMDAVRKAETTGVSHIRKESMYWYGEKRLAEINAALEAAGGDNE